MGRKVSDRAIRKTSGTILGTELIGLADEDALSSATTVDELATYIGGGGAPAVSSVNGETGAVVLDAADVGATTTADVEAIVRPDVETVAASRALALADEGKILRVTDPATLTVPDGLPAGWSVQICADDGVTPVIEGDGTVFLQGEPAIGTAVTFTVASRGTAGISFLATGVAQVYGSVS